MPKQAYVFYKEELMELLLKYKVSTDELALDLLKKGQFSRKITNDEFLEFTEKFIDIENSKEIIACNYTLEKIENIMEQIDKQQKERQESH